MEWIFLAWSKSAGRGISSILVSPIRRIKTLESDDGKGSVIEIFRVSVIVIREKKVSNCKIMNELERTRCLRTGEEMMASVEAVRSGSF